MNAPEPLLSRAGVTGLAAPHRVGPFEFQSVLCRGEGGLVYRAWDHALARPVAIKEYVPSGLARREPDGRVVPVSPAVAPLFERGRGAFVDEARALARCDHPSLVRVLHLVEADGTAYRVMPLYAGRTLQVVRREMAGPPDEAALRALLDDLLGALEVFHKAAGPHGAVSAAQVLLLEDDRAVLLGPAAAERATLPAHGPAPSLAGDLHALALLARWCITGDAEPAAGLGVPEPLAATVDRMYFDQPGVGYSPALLRALDIVLSPDLVRRPQHAAQLREWLAGNDLPPFVPPAPVDSATVGAIRSAIDSIPDTPPAQPAAPIDLPPPATPRPAAPAVNAALPRPALDDLRGMAPFRAEPSRGGRAVLWTSLLVLVLGAAGYAAWQMPLPALHGLGDAGPPRQAGTVAPAQPAEPAAPARAEAVATPAAAEPPVATTTAPPAAPAASAVLPLPAPTPPVAEVAPPAAAPAPVAPAEPAPTRAAAADAELGEPAASVPAAAAKRPALPAPTRTERRPAATNPRELCGARTDFALYRCMQQQCAAAAWSRHPQCVQLRETDRVE